MQTYWEREKATHTQREKDTCTYSERERKTHAYIKRERMPYTQWTSGTPHACPPEVLWQLDEHPGVRLRALQNGRTSCFRFSISRLLNNFVFFLPPHISKTQHGVPPGLAGSRTCWWTSCHGVFVFLTWRIDNTLCDLHQNISLLFVDV